jgi:GNAT superfamily N-acetyltransferase
VIDPRKYFVRENLEDGTEVTVRAIRSEDGPVIRDVFSTLDGESIYRRFFSPKKELSAAELSQLTTIDFDRVVALVATAPTSRGEALIAGARYATGTGDRPQSAELAFLTVGTHRGRGTASLLLRHLVQIARDVGLSRFEADVLAENQPMLNVFRRSGLPTVQRRDGNVIHITLSLEPDANAPA